MTKTEELRKKVLGNYPKIRATIKGIDRLLNIIESVDFLIIAAEKQERKRIRMECVGPVYEGSKVITTMPDRALYLVPVDVVRPEEAKP